MGTVLIKGGRIVTAVDDYHGDLYIENGVVTHIARELSLPADTILDASGKLVLPGGIDPHTHFDMPFGGTTSIIDFAIQQKGKSTIEGLDAWHKKAEGKACIDYAFHMIVTDLPDERVPELRRLADEGVTSYKLFMAYPGVLYVDDGTLYRAFRKAGEDGSVICMHAENGIVIDEIVKRAKADGKTEPKWHALTRPTRMEAEGVHRAIAIAEVANVPVYIVHLSSADALEEVKRARDRGVHAHAETCPQYLLLDQSYYDKPDFEGAKWVMTPALREKSNQEALWTGLRMNSIQAISTDHCPFCFNDQKQLGRDDFTKIPNGAPGVENRMALIYNAGVNTGRISLNRFVQLTSTNAAKMFGLFPRKGTIAVGSDADIVIFDPNREETIGIGNERTHHMRVDYSAWEGFTVKGYPDVVLSQGKVVVDRGKWTGKTGAGRFMKRSGYSGFNL